MQTAALAVRRPTLARAARGTHRPATVAVGRLTTTGENMSWLAAKAEELLQSADKVAGAEIHRVKERAGILKTPAVGAADEEASAEPPPMVVLSQAAAALLAPDEREQLLASGTATIEAAESSDVPATPAAGAAASEASDGDDAAQLAQARRLRAAEWSALQQELQILSMHGRRLQSRLTVCAAQLTQARAAEAEARRQLEEADEARATAEHAAFEARGSVGEQRDASDARVSAAEAKAAAAERNATEQEALAQSVQEELALARQELSRADEAATLHAATLASVRLELSNEREEAAQGQHVAAERLRSAEEHNHELHARNQALSSAVAEEARTRERATPAKEAAATMERLEAELMRARQERSASIEEGQQRVRQMDELAADLAAAQRQTDEAMAARAAAERALATAQRDARTESDARAAAAPPPQARAAASGGPDPAAARAAAALAERDQRLERLLSERTALKFQLEAETNRRAAVERQLASGAPAVRIDMGGGGGEARSALLGSGRANNQREAAASRFISRLLEAQVRHPPPWLVQTASAADDLSELVDRVALTAGRHLRLHRALRLAAVGYVLMVHMWILILLWHMIPSMPEPPARAATTAKHILSPGQRM